VKRTLDADPLAVPHAKPQLQKNKYLTQQRHLQSENVIQANNSRHILYDGQAIGSEIQTKDQHLPIKQKSVNVGLLIRGKI